MKKSFYFLFLFILSSITIFAQSNQNRQNMPRFVPSRNEIEAKMVREGTNHGGNVIKDIIIPLPANNQNRIKTPQAICTGQNLVNNPDFEEYSSCPTSISQISKANGWNTATINTPDYFNTCSSTQGSPGYQVAKSGVAYAGIYTFNSYYPITGRDYIQTYLTERLIAGKTYCVSFYVSLPETMMYGCNNLGLYFSRDSVQTQATTLPFVPQIKNNLNNSLKSKTDWTLISGIYTAQGGEGYIVIGNFSDPIEYDTTLVGGGGNPSSYYYIDDISIVEVAFPSCDSVKATFGYTINGNDVAFKDSSTLSSSNFKWFFGDGSSSTAQKPKHTYTSNGIYTVKLIASNWCTSDSIVKQILIGPCPNVDAGFSYTKSEKNIILTDTSLNASNWQWSFGDGMNSTQQNPSHTYTMPGNYSVSLIASSFCSSDTVTKSILICDTVQAAFGYTISENALRLSDSSLNANNWLWNFGDNINSTEQNPIHIYSNPGNYSVRLIASNFCSSDTTIKNIIIEAPVASNVFKLYPNPTKGQVKIEYNLTGSLQASIDIFSVSGSKLKSFPLNATQQTASIDISSFANGLYIYKLIADGVVREYGKIVLAR